MFAELSAADLIGSLGVSMLLGAFALNLMGRLNSNGLIYPALNTMGAGLAAYASWLIEYWPFVVLEGTWCVVSAIAFVSWGNHFSSGKS